jgi:8-oxo-dGTP pyrophosphatase MutT (NUDIX family)
MTRKEIKPWKVKNSQYVIDRKWLRIRADDCETPEGVAVSPYYVFEYLDWVHVVPFNKAGEILIIEQYRHGIGEVCYELPGGSLDAEDENPDETVRRELREETGYSSDNFEKIGAFSANPATHNNMMHVYIAHDCYRVGEQELDHSEDIAPLFVTAKELLSLIKAGKMPMSLHIGSIYLALDKLGMLKKL